MFAYANAVPVYGCNLRTISILENITTKASSGENCIRFHLPVIVNNTEESVLDKISTHSYEVFAFLWKKLQYVTTIMSVYTRVIYSYNFECNLIFVMYFTYFIGQLHLFVA